MLPMKLNLAINSSIINSHPFPSSLQPPEKRNQTCSPPTMSSCLKKCRRNYRRLNLALEPDLLQEEQNSTQTKKAAAASRTSNSSHPVLTFFGSSNKEKAAAKPEMMRYLEYMKEAGTWEPSSASPAIYFK
ncbi:uncharacterized protein LOC110027578 [Phalaenopsis equestris]|uniref:uncharacterized protein LOC110027578 n=1 Tax=Phalaenopsis equestris TaxID=78828 RepID=UPI0009E44B4A|nr:uncharacterized protein LOC110027578 [Phalaenopsis equestris]